VPVSAVGLTTRRAGEPKGAIRIGRIWAFRPTPLATQQLDQRGNDSSIKKRDKAQRLRPWKRKCRRRGTTGASAPACSCTKCRPLLSAPRQHSGRTLNARPFDPYTLNESLFGSTSLSALISSGIAPFTVTLISSSRSQSGSFQYQDGSRHLHEANCGNHASTMRRISLS
jgi:hypothetical protein